MADLRAVSEAGHNLIQQRVFGVIRVILSSGRTARIVMVMRSAR